LSDSPRICRDCAGFVKSAADSSNSAQICQNGAEFVEFALDLSRRARICQSRRGFVKTAADLSNPARISQDRGDRGDFAARRGVFCDAAPILTGRIKVEWFFSISLHLSRVLR
jgi:hypothetical protein